jgi:two-component system response regulator TctD
MKILLAEDNRPFAQWLTRTLEHERYVVDCTADGSDADLLLTSEEYDLVILDLSLPRMDGRDVLRRLRARENNVPVLILTANNTIAGRVRLLDQGADDYLGKPFEIVELEARIRALLRRSSQHKNPLNRCGNLVHDSNTRLFAIDSTPLTLPQREYAVLEALMAKVGKTVSKRALIATLGNIDEDVSPEAIELYIHRLRKKIETSNATIITLRGLGYLLKQRDES